MVKIRLKRMGAKKQARFRIVAVDSRGKRDGRALENLGHLNPCTDPPQLVLKEDRVRAWLADGAQPTVAAASILRRAGIALSE